MFDLSMFCSLVLVLLFLFVLLRIILILHSQRFQPSNELSTCKTMIVIGSGGHTSEMMKLLNGLSDQFVPRLYVLADTDHRSESKVKQYERNKSKDNKYVLLRVRRSREVSQSWLSTICTTFLASVHSIFILYQHKPDLILCNGPGTCIPICGAAFLLKIFFLTNTRIVFIESICRVKTLSLTGKILYTFADKILLQWPELIKTFPRAEYIGRLI